MRTRALSTALPKSIDACRRIRGGPGGNSSAAAGAASAASTLEFRFPLADPRAPASAPTALAVAVAGEGGVDGAAAAAAVGEVGVGATTGGSSSLADFSRFFFPALLGFSASASVALGTRRGAAAAASAAPSPPVAEGMRLLPASFFFFFLTNCSSHARSRSLPTSYSVRNTWRGDGFTEKSGETHRCLL